MQSSREYVIKLISEIRHKGVYLRHIKFRDVIFYATWAYDAGYQVRVQGWWINMACKRPGILARDAIEICLSDLPHWRKVKKPRGIRG